jgi:hypothetical protein
MLSLIIGSTPIHLGELSFFEQHGLRNRVKLHVPTSSCSWMAFLKVFIHESHPNKKNGCYQEKKIEVQTLNS